MMYPTIRKALDRLRVFRTQRRIGAINSAALNVKRAHWLERYGPGRSIHESRMLDDAVTLWAYMLADTSWRHGRTTMRDDLDGRNGAYNSGDLQDDINDLRCFALPWHPNRLARLFIEQIARDRGVSARVAWKSIRTIAYRNNSDQCKRVCRLLRGESSC